MSKHLFIGELKTSELAVITDLETTIALDSYSDKVAANIVFKFLKARMPQPFWTEFERLFKGEVR
jgi:hypothetical protein